MPPPDDYSIGAHDGVDVVTIQTENLLGALDVNRISAELTALAGNGSSRLILDMHQVLYVGSAALGMLIAMTRELHGRGGKLVLVGVGNFEKLLKISRARSVLNIARDLPEARAMFN